MSVATTPAEAAQGATVSGSRDRFERVLSWLDGDEAADLSHGELQERLQVDARELFRQLLPDHLDLRARTEARLADVMDEARAPRTTAETWHTRAPATVFGEVEVAEDRLPPTRTGQPATGRRRVAQR
jgi:hypothetical protein